MVTYRVHSPIVGFEVAPEGMKIVSLKSGAVLTVPNSPLDRPWSRRLGTVGIVFNEHYLNVFRQDLKDCAELE
jgi:hypothetical protein